MPQQRLNLLCTFITLRRRQDSNLHGISATAFRERPFDQIQALLPTFQTIIFLIEFQYENCHHRNWGKDRDNVGI